MIQVTQLTKNYASHAAVKGISFHVEPGQIVGFLGPNGAGKSTTMRILSGYLPPTSGTATVGGKDVFTQSLAVRQQVGYMPESAPLYTDMKVKEYLHFRGGLRGLRGRTLGTRTGEAMDLCGITDVRRRLIGNLSKGYRQRVALADALLAKPPLLILDEPTNGLDPTQIRQVREMLRSLAPQSTILYSTHILSEVEASCDRVIMLHKGKIKADDTPENLTRSLRTAGTLLIEMKATKGATQKLMALPGVKKATNQKLDDGYQIWTLRIEANADLREAAQALAVTEKWPIREIYRELPSLEDVFIELAASDT